MVTVIKVIDGSYNIFGMEDGAFFLQGNCTEAQLYALLAEIDNALMKKED